MARCNTIRTEQFAAARALKGDMKYWFARVYYFVTTRELEFVRAGKYRYHQQNLENWNAGNKDQVEAQWREAFAAAEGEQGGSWHIPRSKEILNSLLPSMEAHIRIDLPRAIAACYATHYSGVRNTSFADFRSDFEAMGPVFSLATDDIRPEIEAESTWADPGNIDALGDGLFPFFFNLTMERKHAWEKADELSGYIPGGNAGAARRRMKAHMGATHPNSGSDTFEVAGSDVLNKVD